MSAFNGHLAAIKGAITAQNGTELAALMRVDEPSFQQAIWESSRSMPHGSLIDQIARYIKDPWLEPIAAIVECARLLRDNRPVDAFDALDPSVDRLSALFREDERGWLVRPLVSLARNVQVAAEAADVALARQGRRPDRLDPKACEHLQSLAHERLYRNPGRKDAQLSINNQRLRIYFRINNLNQAKHLIQSAEDTLAMVLDRAPAADAVTFKFFCGRLAVLQENYPKAVADLGYALKRCNKRAAEQQRCILGFLIPARLLTHPREMPSDQLIDSFGLSEFKPVVQALRCGSVKLFNDCIESHLETFIQRGVYFLVERLKVYVYRRLFRRVAAIYSTLVANETEATRVPLQLFQEALKSEGESVDLDEVECILANLIYRGLVKGYLSHSHRKIVLMKGNKDQQFPLANQGGLRLV